MLESVEGTSYWCCQLQRCKVVIRVKNSAFRRSSLSFSRIDGSPLKPGAVAEGSVTSFE